ncbi:MAG: hypothetical protein JWO10_289, partial [Microbacteriaceae bacterium]|nr:hypothetical protein [Microbacteriaceae bacterium]
QVPERMPFDPEVLDRFLGSLPRTTAEALALAEQHDDKVDGRAYVQIDRSRPMRHALEVRNYSFATDEAYEVLRRHRVAMVLADTAGRWPMLRESTTDFRYVRLHGSQELYSSGYSDGELDSWAAEIRQWLAAGQDVYVYFDNDAQVHAPFDAIELAKRLC